MDLKNLLESRGILYQYTDEQVFSIYEKGNQALYIGIDPTADSLQLGNLVPLILAFYIASKYNKLYILIGGATGTIGDPSGKDSERTLKSIEEINENGKKIYLQILGLIDRFSLYFGSKFDVELVNNYDFYKDMNILYFLREVGKYITVNQMISKESVKNRIFSQDKTISYTEFSYMLLQGYDFLKLCSEKGVLLQVGGSDQWGNITVGIDLVQKKLNKQAYGITSILLTTYDGKKFGKSEGNAIWIDKQKNSGYSVYQYFINTSDEDVEKFLKVLTFLSIDDINNIMKKHNSNPEERYAQKILAFELVKFLFGEEEATLAKKATEVLFGDLQINSEILDILLKEVGGIYIEDDLDLIEVLVRVGLASSKTEARNLIKQGGIYINGKEINENKLPDGKYLIIRKGKKSYKLVIRMKG